VLQPPGGIRFVVRPALPRDKDMQRAFVRDLSDEVRSLSVHDNGECFDLIAKVDENPLVRGLIVPTHGR
jgi:hypothetical protein